MRSKRWKVWAWYGVLAAIVTGLFVPTMIANAALVPVPACPIHTN
jgi:hypothetical protein